MTANPIVKCIDCKKYDPVDRECSVIGCVANIQEKNSECDHGFELIEQAGVKMEDNKEIRQFDTGATRDVNVDKLNYEGFFSPLVLQRYAQYLHKHRVQSDGNLRDADNWQKGIPIKTYMEGKLRHTMATWLIHRGYKALDEKGNKIDLEESLCAEIFNAMGHLFEILKEKSCGKIK